MKVIVKEKNEKQEIKFPCLMVSEMGTIVLFNSDKQGVVISKRQKESLYGLGDIIDHWDLKFLNPFNGEITLSND